MPTTAERPPGQYVDFDEYVDYHLDKVRRGVKLTDLLTAVAGIGALVLGYLLVFVVFDHWVVPGGFGRGARLAMLLAVVVAAIGWVVWKVVIPARRRVTALYAADVIERAEPALAGNLRNLIDLREAGRSASPLVTGTMEKRAALRIAEIDVDESIDRRLLLRVSYVLAAVVVIGCLYVVLSPKNVSTSLWRALMPTSATNVSTRTRILEVLPGDAEILARSRLDVTVDVAGEEPEAVTLLFTTKDRRFVDEPLVLRPDDEFPKRYLGTLVGENGRGLLQDLEYRVVANDAEAGPFKVAVLQPPAATVDEVTVTPPAYTKLPAKTRPGGHVDGLEGSTIEWRATTNQPVEKALVQFSDDETFATRAEELRMQIGPDGRTLTARLENWAKRSALDVPPYPRYYRVQVWNERGNSDPEPTTYRVDLDLDLPPEVFLVDPAEDLVGPLARPANGNVPLAIRAKDDFGVTYVRLKIAKQGEDVYTEPIFDEGEVAVYAPAAPFVLELHQPGRLELEPGDVIEVTLQARDNKRRGDELRSQISRETTPLRIEIAQPAEPEQLEQQERQDAARRERRIEEHRRQNGEQPQPGEARPREGQPAAGENPQPGDGNPMPGEGNPMPGEGNPQPGENPADPANRDPNQLRNPGDAANPAPGENPQPGDNADPATDPGAGGNPRPLDREGGDDDLATQELLDKFNTERRNDPPADPPADDPMNGDPADPMDGDPMPPENVDPTNPGEPQPMPREPMPGDPQPGAGADQPQPGEGADQPQPGDAATRPNPGDPMPGEGDPQPGDAPRNPEPGDGTTQPRPGEATPQPMPGEGADPMPGDPAPQPGEGAQPKPGEGAQPKPGEGARPKPGEGAEPKPGDAAAQPMPGEGTEPRPGEGVPPQPGEGAQPKPGEGAQPKPGDGAQPKPGEGAQPQPGAGSDDRTAEERLNDEINQLEQLARDPAQRPKVQDDLERLIKERDRRNMTPEQLDNEIERLQKQQNDPAESLRKPGDPETPEDLRKDIEQLEKIRQEKQPQPQPGDPKPGDPMPGEPMPGEPMPGEPMPGEPMPGEPMPGDGDDPPQPGDAAQPKPGGGAQPKPGDRSQPKPGEGAQPKPGEGAQPKPGDQAQPKPGEAAQPKPANGEPQPGEAPGQPKPGDMAEPKPGDPAGQPKPGDATQPKPGDPAAGDPPQPGEPQPGEPQPGEPQPGEPKPGEPQPGDPTEPAPGQPMPGDAGQPKPGDAAEPKPGDMGQPKPGDPNAGEPKPGEPNSGEPKPGERLSDEQLDDAIRRARELANDPQKRQEAERELERLLSDRERREQLRNMDRRQLDEEIARLERRLENDPRAEPKPGDAESPEGLREQLDELSKLRQQAGQPRPGDQPPQPGDMGQPKPGDMGQPKPGEGAPMPGEGAPMPGEGAPMPGEGAPMPGENGQPMPGEGAGQPKPGDAPGQPRPGDQNAGGQPQKGVRQPGDALGPRGGQAASGGESNLQETDADLESARKATELALKKLEEDMKRGEIDPELLERLGWNEADLANYLDRMRQRFGTLDQPEPAPETAARQRQFEELLKGLDFRSDGAARKARTDRTRAVDGFSGRDVPPPPEYREAADAFSRSLPKLFEETKPKK